MHVCDRQTDRQTDRILIAIPHLHYMQRGKNCVCDGHGQGLQLYCALQLYCKSIYPPHLIQIQVYCIVARRLKIKKYVD